ncbi:inner membrane protein [Ketogulonicigenium vulgare Y25]|nr:inner membrane protein [Ketogulonicigenium vulgare Y25]ALJ82351.1 RNA helicase [Ketogulonicigenium vulgare]ANW35081.1 RNA helicase [Ketogulonicigenium vulgare]
MDIEDRRRTLVIAAGDLVRSASDVAAQLAERGLAVMGTPSQLVRLLRQWIPARDGWLATEAGWITVPGQRAYQLPNGSILCASKQRMPVIGLKDGAHAENTVSGSLEGWRNGVAALARGNPLAMFTISAALAGAILEPLGVEGGGYNVHGGTSSGKTTVLMAAQSVFGPPDDMMQWHATESAFEAAARSAKDGAMIVDEIPTRDRGVTKAIGRVLYMLANGTGKKRSNMRLADVRPADWRTMLLTSAEASLTEIHAAAGLDMPEGLTVRLADIRAKSWVYGGFAEIHGYDSPASFSDALKSMARRDYGHAGPAFLKRLIAAEHAGEGDKLRQLYVMILSDLQQKISTGLDRPLEGPETRVLRRFAAVSLAGQIASRWGIVAWTPQEMRNATAEIANRWLAQRRQQLAQPSAEVIGRIRDYLSQHMDRFADLGAGTFDAGVHDGWYDAETIALSTEVFAEIMQPMAARTAARELLAKGALIPGGEAQSLQQRRSPRIDPNRGREYWVRKAAVGLDACSGRQDN